jgi:hypothetical protein
MNAAIHFRASEPLVASLTPYSRPELGGYWLDLKHEGNEFTIHQLSAEKVIELGERIAFLGREAARQEKPAEPDPFEDTAEGIRRAKALAAAEI